MTDKIFLRPADGRRVRRPDGAVLAEDGERVAPSHYWHRRIDAGDVTTSAPQARKPQGTK